ncbi:MAG TPA: peptide-methionine (S)-S-oxide reductase MsrA [Gemmatimonadaceae bacterium]
MTKPKLDAPNALLAAAQSAEIPKSSAARAGSPGPSTRNTMKAIRIHRRGGPEAIVYEDVPVPTLQPGDALIRVHAAGISPAEFTWRIWEMPDGRTRLPLTPSHEVSGVVAAVAPDVREVEVGEAVYALNDFFRDGAAAEYVAVRAAELAPKPASLDHQSAAAIPLSALTAWQALFDHARLTPGQRVLVHGAAGGVGSFASQLACWRGAHVIGTASARNVDFVRELGVHDVIDYGATPFESVVRDVDVVLDTVGGTTTERSWSVLRPGGLLVTIVRPPSPEWTVGRAARGLFFVVEPSRTQLIELSRLLDAGLIRPIVEAVLPLDRAREAYERGIRVHPRGKLVLAVVGRSSAPTSTSESVIEGTSLRILPSDFPKPLVDLPLTSTGGPPATAILAGGCFWCTEAVYRQLDGVHSVTPGYAGGTRETADYETVSTGDTKHAEAIRITYDPARLTYGQLLRIFFSVAHDPTQRDRQGNDVGPQYRSALFPAGADQVRVAEAYVKQLDDAGAFTGPIVTTIEPDAEFHEAETYHHDYARRNPRQGYIMAVSTPKIRKLEKYFPEALR